MARRFSLRRSFVSATPFYLALLLLVVSLGISLSGGWLFFALFRETKEEELGQRLIAVGLASEASLSNAADFLFLLQEASLAPDDDRGWERVFESLLDAYRDRFEEVHAVLVNNVRNDYAGLRSAVLVSREGRVVADPSGERAAGRPASFVAIDRYAFEQAVEGEPASTPAYEYDGVPYKRVYVPIRMASPPRHAGRVGAVLQLEASYDAFGTIANMRAQGLILAAVVTASMAIVALLFLRLVRFVVDSSEHAAHRDRLEAMGLLTAGIAHEVRNPLGIIRSLAEAMMGDFEPDAEEREMAEGIVGEVERLNNLINQYLSFARPEAAIEGDFARPAEMLPSLAQLVEKGDSTGPTVRLQIDDDTPPVAMHESALRQVMLNLLFNARDASTADSPIDVRCVRLRGRGLVEITVRDRGAGISRRDLRKVFEPFYTTKAQGSGLGLAICRQLIEECRGRIDIESEPGAGTAVRVVLPRVP